MEWEVTEEQQMGMRGAANVELLFDDARIPKDNLLGKEGEGFKILLETYFARIFKNGYTNKINEG